MEYDSYLILGRFWGMDQICTGKWDGFKKWSPKNSQFICGFHGVPFDPCVGTNSVTQHICGFLISVCVVFLLDIFSTDPH